MSTPSTRFHVLAGTLTVAALIVFIIHPVQSAVILPNLPPGSHYELIFVTSGTVNAESSIIAEYNTFANVEAALSPTLPADLAWRAVASTATVGASTNAPSMNVPVYNTHGVEVASSATGLYTQNLLAPIAYDQFGLFSPNEFAWTGGQHSWPAVLSMGELDPLLGNIHNANTWSSATVQLAEACYPIYALSCVITVPLNTPEPATIVQLATALISIGGAGILRRRNRARRAA